MLPLSEPKPEVFTYRHRFRPRADYAHRNHLLPWCRGHAPGTWGTPAPPAQRARGASGRKWRRLPRPADQYAGDSSNATIFARYNLNLFERTLVAGAPTRAERRLIRQFPPHIRPLDQLPHDPLSPSRAMAWRTFSVSLARMRASTSNPFAARAYSVKDRVVMGFPASRSADRHRRGSSPRRKYRQRPAPSAQRMAGWARSAQGCWPIQTAE